MPGGEDASMVEPEREEEQRMGAWADAISAARKHARTGRGVAKLLRVIRELGASGEPRAIGLLLDVGNCPEASLAREVGRWEAHRALAGLLVSVTAHNADRVGPRARRELATMLYDAAHSGSLLAPIIVGALYHVGDAHAVRTLKRLLIELALQPFDPREAERCIRHINDRLDKQANEPKTLLRPAAAPEVQWLRPAGPGEGAGDLVRPVDGQAKR